MKKIAMLDRDGVINKDRGYVGFKKDFVWMPGVKKTIKSLKENGFLVIVVSNQSGVARNYFKYRDVILLHKYIQNELKKFGTKIDAFYFSPKSLPHSTILTKSLRPFVISLSMDMYVISIAIASCAAFTCTFST